MNAMPRANASRISRENENSELTIEGAAAGRDGASNGKLEEQPQSCGGQTESSDFFRAPDAESPSAAGLGVAVAAQDPACADGLSPGATGVKAVQKAMANEGADDVAVRA